MKTTWFRILFLALLSLGSLVALSIEAPVKKPSTPPPAPATSPPATTPSAPPATPPAAPAPDNRVEEPTEAEKKDPDGGFLPAPESDKPIELPPEMRGTADYDISFPIDI